MNKQYIKIIAFLLFFLALVISMWTITIAAEATFVNVNVQKSDFYNCVDRCEEECFDIYVK